MSMISALKAIILVTLSTVLLTLWLIYLDRSNTPDYQKEYQAFYKEMQPRLLAGQLSRGEIREFERRSEQFSKRIKERKTDIEKLLLKDFLFYLSLFLWVITLTVILIRSNYIYSELIILIHTSSLLIFFNIKVAAIFLITYLIVFLIWKVRFKK